MLLRVQALLCIVYRLLNSKTFCTFTTTIDWIKPIIFQVKKDWEQQNMTFGPFPEPPIVIREKYAGMFPVNMRPMLHVIGGKERIGGRKNNLRPLLAVWHLPHSWINIR